MNNFMVISNTSGDLLYDSVMNNGHLYESSTGNWTDLCWFPALKFGPAGLCRTWLKYNDGDLLLKHVNNEIYQ